MKYDQEYINGLGAISRRSLRSKQGKTKSPPPAKRRPANRDEDEEPKKKEKDLYYKKRKYPFESVDTVNESVKFIRRFVNLCNAKTDLSRLTAFIRALQKAIVQRLIRRSSPHAKDIATIQEIAIEHYRKARGKQVFIALEEKLRDKYFAIGRGEKVRGSVSILKRFVGLIDLPYGSDLKRRIESILDSLAHLYKKEIIKKNDPYFVKVKEAELAMKKALRDHSPVRVSVSALNGINGIIEYENVEPDFFDEGGTDLNGIENAEAVELSDEPNTVPALLTGEQLREMEFDSVELDKYNTELLGQPARNFFMLVYGPPWHGKTSYVLCLSKCIAERVGKVAYVSPEQHGSKTQQFVAASMGALSTNGLVFVQDLEAAGDLREYACLVIDSGNAAGLKLHEADILRRMLPNTALVVILQSTKDDDFKGEQGWRHIPDIVVKVKDRKVSTEKNRYKLEPVTLPTPAPVTRQLTPPNDDTRVKSKSGLNGNARKACAVFALGSTEQFTVPEIKVSFEEPRKRFAKVRGSYDLEKYARSLFDEGEIEVQEQFMALYLDTGNHVIGYYKHAKGGIDATIADVRLIYSVALKSLSTGIVLIHNHPAGIMAPSESDKRLTKKFIEAGALLEIRVLDHIILGEGSKYYSFADNGEM